MSIFMVDGGIRLAKYSSAGFAGFEILPNFANSLVTMVFPMEEV